MKRLAKSFAFVALLALAGCAGMQRSCCSSFAEDFGADWVVVQMDMNGYPFRCWRLNDTSITNEKTSDGIYWLDRGSGNLVHISGMYNRVQVVNKNWTAAFSSLGLTSEVCDKIHRAKVEFPKTEVTIPFVSVSPTASSTSK